MKTRAFVSILILVLVVLIVGGNYVTGQDKVEAPIEPLYETWVNPEYDKGTKSCSSKFTIRPDGTFSYFGDTRITEGTNGTYTIVDSWVDSNGNKYYTVEVLTRGWGGGKFHETWRLSENNTVWDRIWGYGEYPTELDPEHPRYCIYYRQE